MRTRIWTAILVSLLLAAMVGCGGGGGTGGGTGASGTLLSGTAMKGPVAGGTVQVFEILSSATLNPRAGIPRYGTTVIAQTTTESDGSYSVSLPASIPSGSLLVQITGGSYKDEATGETRSVAGQFGGTGLRAIFGYSAGAPVRAAVTPFTEMAVLDMGPSPTSAVVSASNAKIAAAFGLSDIINIQPLNPTAAFPAGSTAAAQQYALALASISQYQATLGAGTPPTLATIAGNLLGEINTPANNGGLAPATQTQIDAAANNFAGSGNNPNPVLNTPAVNPTAPAAIQTTPSLPGSASISTTVTITANLVTAGQTPVPDGTVVTFSTNLGTLSATSATTVNGQASVTLTSTGVGTASVTVSSGSISDSVATITFVDPNAPVSINLTKNVTSGVTTGPPVTLTASVTRAAGGPVPNGTVVSFSVVSGSGTLSAASAVTSGGVASVNLTSTAAAASVGVRAVAGAASADLSVPFIAQPTQAIVKVRSIGTLPAGVLIGGINATVTYATNKGLSIAPSAVAASGAGAGTLLERNTNNAGQVVLGLITTSGIGLGEFATLTFSIAAGNFPTEADFGVANGSLAIDTATANLPGVSAQILGVTIQ